MARNAARLTQDELASLRAATTLSSQEAQDLIHLATEPSSTVVRPGVSPDEVMARRLWQGELNEFARTLEDRQLAMDLTTAQRERVTLETVRRRREAATATPKRALPTSAMTTAATQQQQGSTTNAPPVRPNPQLNSNRNDCVICLSPINITPPAYTAPCSHRFCHPCLEEYYLNAVKDESLFPPKCCGFAIHPLNSIGYISTSVRQAYYKAAKEYGTKDRVYCYKPVCLAFLGGDLKEPQESTCSECGRVTCSACKAPAHEGSVACAADADDDAAEKLLAMYTSSTRCKGCARVLYRRGGCEHVVCHCGADFNIA